jgi:hypothetical protein
MNKRLFIVLFIILTGIFFISTSTYAAWTQAKGHAYNQLTFSYYKSKDKYSSIENNARVIKLVEQPKYVDYKLTYYGEYGITNDFTAFTSVPYVYIQSEEVDDTIGEDGPEGIGDINLGARYKLVNNLFGTGMLMSIQTQVKIPEAYETQYDFENPLNFQNIGDGQYDWTVSLLFGKGFNKGYAVVNAGYKFRFENDDLGDSLSFTPSDQIVVRIDGGYSLHPKLSLRGNIEWAKSIGNASIGREWPDALVKTFGEDITNSGKTEQKIINDTLTLEPSNITVGVALAISITAKIQTVLSYNQVIDGWGTDVFRSSDTGQGETYAIAMVYIF